MTRCQKKASFTSLLWTTNRGFQKHSPLFFSGMASPLLPLLIPLRRSNRLLQDLRTCSFLTSSCQNYPASILPFRSKRNAPIARFYCFPGRLRQLICLRLLGNKGTIFLSSPNPFTLLTFFGGSET